MILEAEKKALKYLQNAEFSNNPVIKVWREAFQKFKTKKGARSSIEALLKRVHNGNHIETINPLVDIYNSISLRYALPCGGEDIDKFASDIRLTTAVGNDEFIPLGTDESRLIEFENALKELAKVVQDNLGGTCTASILDIYNKEVTIE